MTDNMQRAEWARVGLQAFANATRSTRSDRNLGHAYVLDEVASDFLADLLHLLGAERMEECLERGRGHYDEELSEAASE
jgi:hypothetical protein